MSVEVAVFDFDGTLTRRDTLLPFLRWICGSRSVAAALARHAPAVGRAATGWGGEEAAKQALFGRLLAGRALTELEQAVPGFADQLLDGGMRTEVVARLGWHVAEGHRLVVVTASPELYVGPIARRLGVELVLGTRLEVDDQGRLTGRLTGANVKGHEKVRRLREALGPVDVGWAYGNSRGDRELLALARHPTMVGKGARR
jgi:HAD superfamily hydrolase (TIGR01490 family)